jgi:5S rRNA maturation endonuclease (ribonuclease M5)
MTRDTKHRSPLGSGDASLRFRIAGEALAEARILNRTQAWPILVEGKRDKLALSVLGFNGPIEVLNRGWALERLIAHLYETYGPRRTTDGGPSICILMDWDRTGGRLQNELRRRMEGMDISISEDLRSVLMKALKPETRVVESLRSMAHDLGPFVDEYDDWLPE